MATQDYHQALLTAILSVDQKDSWAMLQAVNGESMLVRERLHQLLDKLAAKAA